MAIINLRDYYPFYTSDCFMEVSEEVAEMFKEFERKEAAYRLRTYRHKPYVKYRLEGIQMKRTVRRGDIYNAKPDPHIGSEQGGTRPVLILSNDTGNRFSPTIR